MPLARLPSRRRRGAAIGLALALLATAALGWAIDGTPICTLTPSSQLRPGLIGRSNGAWVVWSDTRNGAEDIYHRRIDSTGVAGSEILLASATSFQNGPIGVPDGGSGAIIAWMDNRAGNYDIYADRIDANGAPQWVPGSGKAVVSAAGNQRFHAVQPDGLISLSGVLPGAYVAWQDDRTGTGDIYAQHLTTAGALWAAEVPVCTATGAQSGVVLASDGVSSVGNASGLVLAWQDLRTGTSDIYAQRLSRTGAAQWAANGVAVSDTVGSQTNPCIARVGQVYYIAWTDSRTSPSRIYAQKLDVNGVKQWPSNGIQVAPTPSGSQSSPVITTSSDGSVVIAWADTRNGATNSNIYAQRLDPTGAPLWPAEGTPICVASGNQTAPIVTTSLNGAVMIAWLDNRNSVNGDIYAQRIAPDRAIQYTKDGIAVTAASGLQSAPRMTNDGGHGAILAWQDERTTDADIYATRIAPTTVLDVPKPTSQGFSLATRSNPAHGAVHLVLELEHAAAVTVDVFDAQGRNVSRLLEGTQEAGRHDLAWQGQETGGAACKAGLYFVRARMGAHETTLKVTLAR